MEITLPNTKPSNEFAHPADVMRARLRGELGCGTCLYWTNFGKDWCAKHRTDPSPGMTWPNCYCNDFQLPPTPEAYMRLFQILDTHTRQRLPEEFADKPAAKRARAKLNAEHDSKLRFVVTPGPDHRKWQKTSTRT